MNQETNEFLIEELNDAHNHFVGIIGIMKDKNIPFCYQELEELEQKKYQEVCELINKMQYYTLENKTIRENNKEIFEYEHKLYITYCSLSLVTLLFIWGYHTIFDTSRLSDIVKYIIGMFLGSTYVGLLHRDINDNRNGTKETRDLINSLMTLKEDYKRDHDKAVALTNDIFKINENLWSKSGREMVKKRMLTELDS